MEKVPPGTMLRLGGMTDCFQPLESQEQITYQTIEQLNEYGIGYLIVTKSHLAGEERYRKLYDPKLAHIQITITCFDDKKAFAYEKASSPSKRLRALLKLQEESFDVTLRLSPLIEEYLDFDYLNRLPVDKVLVEFLRVNGWIKKCTCTLTLCTTHSNVYYRSTEIRKEAAIQILEQLYDAGRQLSGKSAGSYHAENISGG